MQENNRADEMILSDPTWRISKEINVAHLLVNVLAIGIAWGMITVQISNLQANKAEVKDVAVLTNQISTIAKNSDDTKASIAGLTAQFNQIISTIGATTQELKDLKEAVRGNDFSKRH